jgi:hypothetical protein
MRKTFKQSLLLRKMFKQRDIGRHACRRYLRAATVESAEADSTSHLLQITRSPHAKFSVAQGRLIGTRIEFSFQRDLYRTDDKYNIAAMKPA